ncbi:hypothetical protein CDEST_06871 [Colletotrichum destructivum]|uniref:Uncharacterized protein n=1 Tax=Colletotrichum destructivum TaxID=34406 RepID=A0AAX4IF14_9PEZI|nr:hypothetical protein CDEST_06871 [Colletotrichum destructivum]
MAGQNDLQWSTCCGWFSSDVQRARDSECWQMLSTMFLIAGLSRVDVPELSENKIGGTFEGADHTPFPTPT